MVAELKMCLIIRSWDISKCYPNAEKDMCIIILQWWGVPDDMIARFSMYRSDTIAVMMEFQKIALSTSNPAKEDFVDLVEWINVNTHNYQCDQLV